MNGFALNRNLVQSTQSTIHSGLSSVDRGQFFIAPSALGAPEKDNTGAIVTAILLAIGLGATVYVVSKSGEKKQLTGFGKDIAKDIAGKAVLVVGGIGAIYLLILRPILQKVGVVETKEDKVLANQAKDSSAPTSPWHPAYYVKRGATIDTTSAERIAKQLYDADGYFNDDENAVYAALKSLTYKTNLSRVVEVFANKYGKDLYGYLDAVNGNGFLDASEMAIVNKIVSDLK